VELIRRAVEESLREDVRDTGQGQMPEMLGQAPAMQDVFRAIGRLSQSNVTVLITGESGTGKELVARAVHTSSDRKDGPFVVVNCGAIPENLIESELFGHEKGSFTGADRKSPGMFRQADGGTLFLDEVGEIPLALQVKLLRALQERKVRPVGSAAEVSVDVRIVAATNRDLAQMVREKTFREDLFYRLNVLRVQLPPLRERREDLPVLIEHFRARVASEGLEGRVTAEAIDFFDAAPFPRSDAITLSMILHDCESARGPERWARALPGFRSGLVGPGALAGSRALRVRWVLLRQHPDSCCSRQGSL
jgi:two-component system nitrogen regulation response regulator GlnG